LGEEGKNVVEIIAKALHAAEGQEIKDVFGEEPEAWEVCEHKGAYRVSAHYVLDALTAAGYVVFYRPEYILVPNPSKGEPG
jgi:hypothetical protein